ncbi:hypothetical protein ACILPE_06030 [Capnocytophaga canimorsus]|uniref:hypothetical protein n=1 Tax=Capnocytophaga canimorsus TaxID=28188 RepID=UPI0037D8A6DD
MKKLVLFCVVLLNVGTYAQKIKVNETDKFTKKKMIETSFEKIVSDGSLLGSTGGRMMKNVWVAFKAVENDVFLRLKWCSNNVLALSEDADIILLDSEGNTYTFKNSSFTIAGEGEGTVGAWGSALYGLNIYALGDCSELKDKKITDLRIYTTDGYIDFSIDKKKTDIISETYKVLEKNL